MEPAGFILDAESTMLANKDDLHAINLVLAIPVHAGGKRGVEFGLIVWASGRI